MIYYLKHIDIEGPGTLGDFFERQGFDSRTIELHNGDVLPAQVNNNDCVVILGGPMNADEEDTYPFLKPEIDFIQQLIKRDILTIGLCLGAQLIAKAAGARVYKAAVKEIGFRSLLLTSSALKDPLFDGIDSPVSLFEWHDDTFDLPQAAELLLQGRDCLHQAFRLGTKVYGFQCHMEITRKDALLWAENYLKQGTDGYKQLRASMEKEFDFYQEKFCEISQKIYNNLSEMLI